jgi:hypothetical protein
MHELTTKELDIIAGGRINEASLRQPTPATSELGKQVNDIAAMLNDFGGWLGRSVYDWTH